MSVTEGCDPTRVVAAGPGLQQALSEKPNNFSIITRSRLRPKRRVACGETRVMLTPLVVFSVRGAGIGGVGITVEGPSESKMSCKDNKDGSCSVEYVPFSPGLYDINITYGGEHIPGETSSLQREELMER